jgi:hypothetical protein
MLEKQDENRIKRYRQAAPVIAVIGKHKLDFYDWICRYENANYLYIFVDEEQKVHGRDISNYTILHSPPKNVERIIAAVKHRMKYRHPQRLEVQAHLIAVKDQRNILAKLTENG